MPPNESARGSPSPARTTYGRLRQRYEARLLAARRAYDDATTRDDPDSGPATREVATLMQRIDDVYVSGAAARRLDPEIIRLRRRAWVA